MATYGLVQKEQVHDGDAMIKCFAYIGPFP